MYLDTTIKTPVPIRVNAEIFHMHSMKADAAYS